MSKKVIVFFVGFIFFFGFNLAHANLVINEIMYAPPAGQKSGDWFEVYNNGPDIIIQSDKTKHDNPWKFSKVGLVTKYYINSPDFTIKSGEYVIFSDDSSTFSTDYTISSNIKVIDSTIALSNVNKTTLQIFDESGTQVVGAEYDPSKGLAMGDGNSLQLMNDGTWKAATPTPGITNDVVVSPLPPAPDSSSTGGSSSEGSSSSSSSSGTGSSSSSSSSTKIMEEPKIKTKITTKALAFVSLPSEFAISTTGYYGEPLFTPYGKYFINFGDGDSMEIKASDTSYLQKFSHTYFYAGDYVVTLEFYKNSYSEIPDASDKITIKVMSAEVIISKVGDEKDFFIELTNNGNIDMDISKWILASASKSFTLPKNTIIPPKSKVIISSKITNFSILDKDTLKLMNPQGEIAFDYLASIVPAVIAKVRAQPKYNQNTTGVQPQEDSTVKPLLDEQIPASTSTSLGRPVENLGASVVSNDIAPLNSSTPYLPGLLSLVFIGASASGVYFIRRRKISSQSEFEILDE